MIGLAAALALFAAQSEAPAPAACPPSSDAKGGIVAPLPSISDAELNGMATAFSKAVKRPGVSDWPREVMDSKASCGLYAIEIGGQQVQVYGAAGPMPPVWAFGSGRLVFLVPLEIAAAPQVRFALVSATPLTRRVERLYDGKPQDSLLRSDIVAALQPRSGEAIATLYTAGGAFSYSGRTQSGRGTVLQEPLPRGGGGIVMFSHPDGEYFLPAPAGAVKMGPSGFLCPAQAGPLPRDILLLIDAEPSSSDQSCRFGANTSAVVSSFVTRLGGGRNAQGALSAFLAQAGATQRRADDDLGLKSKTARGEAWIDRNGLGQAVYVIDAGSWIVHLRVTYAPQRRADVAAAVDALAEQAARTLGDLAALPVQLRAPG